MISGTETIFVCFSLASTQTHTQPPGTIYKNPPWNWSELCCVCSARGHLLFALPGLGGASRGLGLVLERVPIATAGPWFHRLEDKVLFKKGWETTALFIPLCNLWGHKENSNCMRTLLGRSLLQYSFTFTYYICLLLVVVLHSNSWKKQRYTKALSKPLVQRKYSGGKLKEESSWVWCSGLEKDI